MPPNAALNSAAIGIVASVVIPDGVAEPVGRGRQLVSSSRRRSRFHPAARAAEEQSKTTVANGTATDLDTLRIASSVDQPVDYRCYFARS